MKVLIVDDDMIYLELVKRHLKDTSCNIYTETDPITALKRYKKERFDLIITDLMMPDMDGIALLKEVKSIDNKANVILHSCVLNYMKKKEAIESGAYAFYEKPAHSMILKDIEILENKSNILSANTRKVCFAA